jgi:predicted Zn-dependent protease
MRRVCVLAVVLPLALAAQDAKNDAKKDPDQIGTRDVSKGINFYSMEKEMAMGRQMSQAVERQGKLLDDQLITGYVNRIGQNLARHSDTKIPLTIKVLDSEEPNAFALPGGYLYVNTGLIRMAETEAELAAAMAHEIAHVAARHGTRQATQGQLAQIAAIPLIFVGGGFGTLCMSAAEASVVPAGSLAVQRGFETEADLLGLEYLYKSGYDPLGMVDIFEKILSFDERKHAKLFARLASTHPGAGDRLANVQKNIEALLKARPEYIVNTSEFDNVKAHLAVLDWIPKPEPAPAPEPPTLRRKTDPLIAKKQYLKTDPVRPN